MEAYSYISLVHRLEGNFHLNKGHFFLFFLKRTIQESKVILFWMEGLNIYDVGCMQSACFICEFLVHLGCALSQLLFIVCLKCLAFVSYPISLELLLFMY